MKRFFLMALIASAMTYTVQAQNLKIPAPSPNAYIKQDFGLSTVEVSYSRPAVKGRAIFGDLVPYDKVWRTGANQATTITFGDDVIINNQKVPAGKYGLLTIPGKNEWTVIISRQLNVTSPAAYQQDQDVVRVKAKVQALPSSVESFTIDLNNIMASSMNVCFIWDKTIAFFPVTTDVDSKVMAQINDAMTKDTHPYFSAAAYYLENGKDLNQALEWFNKAIEQNPKAFYMYYQKAKCLAQLGKKQEAIATANQSIELAKAAKNDDYVALNQKLIASLK